MTDALILSRDEDFHISYELVLCHQSLQHVAGDFLIELVAHVQITVWLHVEAFGDGFCCIVEAVLYEAVLAANIGDLLLDFSFEVLSIIRCAFEMNDHNVTTLFILYGQYTT